jgi:tryptophan-rich sensory protein
MNPAILKKPSAWIPITISLIVFAIMLIAIATFGAPARQPDEGTAAHLFQIWLVVEVLMIAFFALKWLPRQPKQALLIVILQIIAMLLPMAIVFHYKL